MQAKTPSAIKPANKGIVGHVLSSLGLLLLCISFFLPQVRGCHDPVVPVKQTLSNSIGFYWQFFLPFFFAFLMVFIYVVRVLVRTANAKRNMIAAGCLVCILVLAIGSFLLGQLFFDHLTADEWRWEDSFWLGVACLAGIATIVACVVAAKASGPRKLPLCIFIVGVCSLGYFLYWVAGGVGESRIYFGLWISVAAGTLIATGGLWEAIRAGPLHVNRAG